MDLKSIKWKEILHEGFESVLVTVFTIATLGVVGLIALTVIMIPLSLLKYLFT